MAVAPDDDGGGGGGGGPPPNPTLTIAATDAIRAEGAAGSTPFTFMVTRAGDVSAASSATWAVAGSGANAAAAADFAGGALPTGAVSFAAGETSKLVTVNIAGDTFFEANEAFTITLAGAAGAVLGAATATGTILNDDSQATLSIAATDAVKVEGAPALNPFTFTITRTGDTSGASSVYLTVTGSGAHPADFNDFVTRNLPEGRVFFAAGETSKVVSVAVEGDFNVEFDETFVITLSAPTGAVLGTSSAPGTILNDDVAPTLALAGPAGVLEGNAGSTPVVYSVTRSGGDTSVALSVNYTVIGSGSNPTEPSDFTGGVMPSGVLTFLPGQLTGSFTVNVAGDTALEGFETFSVVLSGATGGAVISMPSVETTIVNDDVEPRVSISASQSLAEGNAGATAFVFTATRTGDPSTTPVFTYHVGPASFGSSPVTGSDFLGGVLPVGVLAFAPGQMTQTFTISVAGDTTLEGDESFVVIVDHQDGVLDPAFGVGTILNDDPGTTLAISRSLGQDEGNTGSTAFTYTVTRSGDTSGATSVDYAVTASGGGDLVEASDFAGGTLPTGTVTFAAGETSKQVTINVAGDTVFEGFEGFELTLSGATGGAWVLTPTTRGTIFNDDAANATPIAVADTATVSEDASVVITVLANDTDPNAGDTKTLVSVNSASALGSVSTNLDGTLTYTPGATFQSLAAGATANDTFAYTMRDAAGAESTATVTVTVTGANDAPTGSASAVLPGGVEDTVYTIGKAALLAGFTDVDASDTLDVLGVLADHGSVSVNPDGSFRITPELDYTGPVVLTYTVTDGQGGGASGTQTFTLAPQPFDQMGGAGNDTLQGTTTADRLSGEGGDDLLVGADGDDLLAGGEGKDSLSGGNGADSLIGGAGLDTLIGGSGADSLAGGGEADSLNGGDGNDWIEGGGGPDVLVGGRGADLFIFGPGFGRDVVTDFRAVEDGVRFAGGVFSSYAEVMSHAAQVGANVLITSAAGDVLQLNNVNLSSLTSADFLFA